ncbi:MAG: hypothetical protein MZW92_14930 [Comamonadaceae bacterium]|nr:hypothetical protein [Comamonadaceae bacterium]
MRRLATAQDAAPCHSQHAGARRAADRRHRRLRSRPGACCATLPTRALDEAAGMLAATRPTAVNLLLGAAAHAGRLAPLAPAERAAAAWHEAAAHRRRGCRRQRAPSASTACAILRDLAQRHGRA